MAWCEAGDGRDDKKCEVEGALGSKWMKRRKTGIRRKMSGMENRGAQR